MSQTPERARSALEPREAGFLVYIQFSVYKQETTLKISNDTAKSNTFKLFILIGKFILDMIITFNICIKCLFLFLTNDLFFHVFQELQTNSNSRNYWTLLSVCYRAINISMEHLSSETNGLFALG